MSFTSTENINHAERMHFLQCPMCTQWFDKRETSEFSKHVHGLDQLTKSSAANQHVKIKIDAYHSTSGVLSFV